MKTISGIILSHKSELIDAFNDSNCFSGIPFAAKYRLIDFPLSNFVNSGIKNVGVFTDKISRELIDHLGDGKDWSLNRRKDGISFLASESIGRIEKGIDTDLRALYANLDYLENLSEEYVIFSGCKFIFNVDFKRIINKEVKDDFDILLLYKKNEGFLNSGIEISFDEENKFKNLEVKYETADIKELFMDVFIVKRKFLINLLKRIGMMGVWEFPVVLDRIKDDIKIETYEYRDYAFYLDSIKKYYLGNMDLLKEENWDNIFNKKRQIYTNNNDCPPSIYGEKAETKNILLASGCIVEGQLRDSVVFRGVRIKRGAKVERAIINSGATIEEDVQLKNVIVESKCRISRGTIMIGTDEKPIVVC